MLSSAKRREHACFFSAPVDVQLDRDEKTMVQPDVLVVCDREKIVPTHVYGAPDLITAFFLKYISEGSYPVIGIIPVQIH